MKYSNTIDIDIDIDVAPPAEQILNFQQQSHSLLINFAILNTDKWASMACHTWARQCHKVNRCQDN